MEPTSNDQVATTSSISKNELDRGQLIADANAEEARKLAKLPPIVKNVYTEDPEVNSMSTSQAAEWRRENFDMKVWRNINDQNTFKPIPNPVLTFGQAFKNYPEIMEKIKQHGFKKPSPIQSQVWPILLGGENLIATAPCGTGKTLAYLLPALIHIKGQIRPKGEKHHPLVLILVPARELAIQIHREICNFIDKDIKSMCLYGGNNMNEQIKAIAEGVDIVVATPGRLKSLIKLEYLDAINFTYIVYDEADKLFEIKLAREVRLALIDARPDHQCVLFSATWQCGVRSYIDICIKNTIEIAVGSSELATVHTVTQQILFLEFDQKDDTLLTFITNMSPSDKVIVFCDKAAVSHVSSELAVKGICCSTLHGKLDQEDREAAFNEISQGATNILVATDVASRGIDIKGLTYVINYSFPHTLEDYVHRISRTGRTGKGGIAITYMTKHDSEHANGLINILKEANQEVPKELEMSAQRYEQTRHFELDYSNFLDWI